jgi:hypothetical protein
MTAAQRILQPARFGSVIATAIETQGDYAMRKLSLIVLMAAGLAACGQTTGDRAVSGGLLGAGAGAAIGSLSGSAGTGALLGGVAGAAGGALTGPGTVNLGRPAWR